MIYKGQIGKPIDLVGTQDLTVFASVYIRYRKPSGATGQWQATVVDTYTARYVTVSAEDVDEHGKWVCQGYAVRAGGSNDFTDQVEVTVGAVIEVAS